jgi:polysaccharide biosynthesis protein PslG
MRRGGALALAALAALLIGSGCGGGGGGGGGGSNDGGSANDPFHGVISAEPLPDGPMLARLGRGGVGTLRINLVWGNAQPTPDSYDWSEYDAVVGNAARNGIRVLATVFSSPAWAEPNPETPPLHGGSLSAFQLFIGRAVERYGTHGQFWKEHPGLPELPITDWQLWNEANSPLFWKPAPSVGDYLALLHTFHDIVKAVDPSARILLAGLFPTPRDGILSKSFLTGLYRRGAAQFFDAVAVHPYAATPQIAIDRVAEARSLMNRFGDTETPIWVTEVGWASRGVPPGLVVGLAGQADYLRQTFELAAAQRERLGIAGVVWYSLQDTPGPIWVGHCGLFRLDGSAKPAWEAFTQVAGGES